MSGYVPCPAPGITHAGAHVTNLPGHLKSTDVLTIAAMREAGILCPTCGGNGMVPVERKPQVGDLADHKRKDLIPRPVAAVSDDGKRIKVAIGLHISAWLPAENYDYTSPL